MVILSSPPSLPLSLSLHLPTLSLNIFPHFLYPHIPGVMRAEEEEEEEVVQEEGGEAVSELGHCLPRSLAA